MYIFLNKEHNEVDSNAKLWLLTRKEVSAPMTGLGRGVPETLMNVR